MLSVKDMNSLNDIIKVHFRTVDVREKRSVLPEEAYRHKASDDSELL